MQSLRKISYSCLIFLFVIVQNINLHPEIKKRILDDGTVQYYNGGAPEAKTPQKYDFKNPYNSLIEDICKEGGMDPYLVKCIIKVESNFNKDAVSVAGAMGLMQIMQDVARSYNVKDPLDPKENLYAGTRHLKSLLEFFKNDITLAVAAYHAGLGNVKKNMNIPPIQSTIDYVNNVMFLYNGKKENHSEKIKKLYKRITDDGVIEIYNK